MTLFTSCTACIALLLSFALACSSQGLCLDYPDAHPGPELIQNGGFENYGGYLWWPSDPEGFTVQGFIQGACGSYAASIETFYTRAGCPRPNAGIFQQVFLSQATPKRVFVSAWASAVNVSGVEDIDFSLYVDVYFTDGTTHYGVYTPFRFTCTTGWNRVSLTIDETKPISYIFVNLLFRGHTGTVYFDTISVKEELLLQYPLGVNILGDGGFESCSLGGNWTQQGGPTCQVQTCGNDFIRTGSGSLSLGPQSQDNCHTSIYQVVLFDPPILNTLTFSAYIYINYSLNALNGDFVNLAIDDGLFTMNTTDVPFNPTNGFQYYDVTLIPTTPVSAVNVQLLLQGKPQGVTYDDVSLVVNPL